MKFLILFNALYSNNGTRKESEMEKIVVAGDPAASEKVTYVLKEKMRNGRVRIECEGRARSLALLFEEQPPDIVIIFLDRIQQSALCSIGKIDPKKTIVIAVLPEHAGDIFSGIWQYPIKWYLPESDMAVNLNRMVEEAGIQLKKEKEIRNFRVQFLYRIENEYRMIILVGFERERSVPEFKRFIRVFARSGIRSSVFIIAPNIWAVLCTDSSEQEVRRHILFFTRYYAKRETGIRFAVSERIKNPGECVKKIRILTAILNHVDKNEKDGQRILYEREYKAFFRGNVRPAVYTACRYVEEHFSKRIRVSEIAEQCYISTNYLSEVFRKDMGIRLNAYIEQVRMEHAVSMLSGGEALVKDVALMCGFRNISYFSNRFKKIYGVSPNKFRAEERKDRDRRMMSLRVSL